jgi:hypothetical protein
MPTDFKSKLTNVRREIIISRQQENQWREAAESRAEHIRSLRFLLSRFEKPLLDINTRLADIGHPPLLLPEIGRHNSEESVFPTVGTLLKWMIECLPPLIEDINDAQSLADALEDERTETEDKHIAPLPVLNTDGVSEITRHLNPRRSSPMETSPDHGT